MLGHLMTLWNLGSKIVNFEYLKQEKGFEKKYKTFFLVAKVLSFRIKKQNSKNISDITFREKATVTTTLGKKLRPPVPNEKEDYASGKTQGCM